MELHQVRYFLAVSKFLNFTRAAEHCNVTQPALTKAVQKLEEELGGELVHRERQLTQLTDLGKMVLPMLERTLGAAEAAQQRAKQYKRREIAPLKIGLARSVSPSVLMTSLSRTAISIPGLQVELIESSGEHLNNMLLEGEINVAVSGDSESAPDRIDQWRLFEERYVVIAKKDDPIALEKSIPLNALGRLVFLEVADCPVLKRLRDMDFGDRSRPEVRHRGAQNGHLQHMVAAGMGVMLAPEYTPRLPSLTAVPLEGDPVRRSVYLLAVSGRRYSPALDLFIKTTRTQDWARGAAVTPTSNHTTSPHVANGPSAICNSR